MQRKVIGFYWTLPAPWAGFSRINELDVEKAAGQSRTIKLQREIIRRWAQEHRKEIVHEQVYLEIAPDRGSDQVRPVLKNLIALATEQNAEILYIDFGKEIRWRSHHFLEGIVGSHIDSFMPIALRDHEAKDLENHFSSWRKSHEEWQQDKTTRNRVAWDFAKALRDQGISFPEVALQLNDAEVHSPTGKKWSGDNVRKFLKSFANGLEF